MSERAASFPDPGTAVVVLRGIVLEELHAHGPSRGPMLVRAIADLEGFSVDEIIDVLGQLAREDLVEVRVVVARDGEDRHAVPLPYWCVR